METVKGLDEPVRRAAQLIWDWHHCGHSLQPAECILALGSNDPRVAERAAQLYLDGYAPTLVFSGGVGRMTEGLYGGLSEAAYFAGIAIKLGVPQSAIIVEGDSTNTGENIALSMRKLTERGLDPSSYIVVQKPYMERRSFATFKRHMPAHKAVVVTSPQIPFDQYCHEALPLRTVMMAMAGDLQRCRLYAQPQRAFQVPVDIPDEVWTALGVLAAAGYTDQLIVDQAATEAAGGGKVVYEGL